MFGNKMKDLLLSEVARMCEMHRAGDMEWLIPVDQFEGGYKRIAAGVNDIVKIHTEAMRKVLGVIGSYGEGDFSPVIENLPGKRGIAHEEIDLMRNSLLGLVADADMLSVAAVEGRLAARADASKHKGDFRKIVQGVDDTLDSVVGFIDEMPTPAMVIDNDFNMLYMNKIGAQVGNRQPKDLLGTKCYDHFKTSDCRTAKCACAIAMQGGHAASSETDAHPGTLNLDIAYSAVPVKNREGKVIGALEFVTDQTAIKQAMRVADKVKTFQDKEVEKLLTGLEALAQGNMEFKLAVDAGDADTAGVKQAFDRLTAAVGTCRDAVNAIVADANMLSKAAVEGKLATRPTPEKFQGELQRYSPGCERHPRCRDRSLERGGRICGKDLQGEYPARITDTYNGDFNDDQKQPQHAH